MYTIYIHYICILYIYYIYTIYIYYIYIIIYIWYHPMAILWYLVRFYGHVEYQWKICEFTRRCRSRKIRTTPSRVDWRCRCEQRHSSESRPSFGESWRKSSPGMDDVCLISFGTRKTINAINKSYLSRRARQHAGWSLGTAEGAGMGGHGSTSVWKKVKIIYNVYYLYVYIYIYIYIHMYVCIVLYCIVLYCMYCIVLYCIVFVLYCIVLYFVVFYCIVFYCNCNEL